MTSTNTASSETVKLDPSAAAGLIARGASAGAQATAAGGAVDAHSGGGASPIDGGVAALRAHGLGLTTGWAAAVSTKTLRRKAGEGGGVAALAEQEAENASRLGGIGPQGAAGTAVTTTG
ncbi:MAG: hypothetical protein AB7G47_09830 [Mycolicibacterium sp.]|uniref:hypothetical protein n=1 Tax=Mycolicibacterium sp. TaxID=2320850 RepID=UPI003D0FF51C